MPTALPIHQHIAGAIEVSDEGGEFFEEGDPLA
jgi:hypothetical protein